MPCLLSKAKRKCAKAGRRGGKTVWEIAEVAVTCVDDGGFCGWGSPNFPILRDAWRDIKTELAPFIAEVRESEWTINFKSGGRLECWSLDTAIVARGRKYHKFILDEAGCIPNLSLRFDAEIEPTLGDFAGTLCAGSTPNISTDFDQWFELGQKPGTGWESWTWASTDNPAVAENMQVLIDGARARGVPEWLIQREYYAKSAESDRNFFRRSDIEVHKRDHGREPLWRGRVDVPQDATGDRFAIVKAGKCVVVDGDQKRELISLAEDAGGPLRIWAKPDPSQIHCMGVDLGYGVGSSNTVFSIGNRHTRRKVAEYAWPGVTPDEAAMLCAMLAYWYTGPIGPAIVCFERNGPGEVFAKRMHELEFGALWYERKATTAVDSNALTMRYGWWNSDKEPLLGAYRAAMVDGKFINPSVAALDECPSYQYDDQMTVKSAFDRTKAKDDPARVKHGDRVIADALLNLCFDWTGEPIKKPAPRFAPGSYGDIFQLEKKHPEIFPPSAVTGWVGCDRS